MKRIKQSNVNRRSRLMVVAIISLGLLLILMAGCTQPAPKPTPSPRTAPAPAPVRNPLPTTPSELNRLANRLAAEAAKVKGVNNASVVINNNTALVGLDLNAGIEAKQTNTIKSEAGDRVRRAEPRLTDVIVTTDIDTVTRLRRIADGIAAGRPVSSFAREITEITRRLAPARR